MLGMGNSLIDVTPGADHSPYFQLENIDPRWLAATGSKSGQKIRREL